MREQIKDIVKINLSRQDNLNRIQEYIQAYFLYILYKKKFYQNLVFTGGTALRFIHKIQRFSEDLDFSLSSKAKKYDFSILLKDVRKEFELSGYGLEIKYKTDKNVHNAFLKFPGILYEVGLSGLKDEKISVKLEIDTNPPQGGIEESTLYNSIFMFYLVHYDLSSLFAGKLHALLTRKYTKGRDWYDLLWYMSKFKDLQPNFIMLNNALMQTQETPVVLSKENWKDELKNVIEELDIEKVRNDVSKFLENHNDVNLLTKENLLNIVKKQ
jgi:predicted nucleotidyltransferase component of viral defense system